MRIEFNEYTIRDLVTEDAVPIANYADNKNIWLNMRDSFPFPYKYSDANAFKDGKIVDQFIFAKLKEGLLDLNR